jgi:signal transduction histidine kinase
MPSKDPLADRKPALAGSDTILHVAGYLTAACIAAAELVDLPLGPRFAWTAGLMAAFIAALAAALNAAHRGGTWVVVVTSLAASALIVAIMALGVSVSLGAILFFVIITIVAMRLQTRAALAWVMGAIAALLVCMLLRRERDWLPMMLSFSVGYFAFFAIALSFRRSLQARAESQQLLAELTRTQGRLRDMAIVEERQRLAREMHDAVGHRLTAAAVLLEGAARLIATEPSRATRMVETSREQVRQGLDELRAAVSALHREVNGTQSTREVLAALVDVYRQGTDAQVILEVDPGLGEPDLERKLVLVRTAQEALTNVQKHAAATRVALELRIEAGTYVLTCRDNGRGIDAVRDGASLSGGSGFGIKNLRARALPFGGRVDLQAGLDGGTELRLELPTASEVRP